MPFLFFLLFIFPSLSWASDIGSAPGLSLITTSGKLGSAITITGSHFSNKESGYIYLDTNKNGKRDGSEASTSIFCSSLGSFTAYLTVPNSAAGTYPIRYSGKTSVSPVNFSVLKTTITIKTTSGKPGSSITINGNNFPNSETGYVYLDVNKNSKKDSGEVYAKTNSSTSGSFTAYLTVPTINAGTYSVRYSGSSSVSPVNFTVLRTTIITNTTSEKPGISITIEGTNFPNNENGYVYLDANKNGVIDDDEAYTTIYNSATGSFTGYMTVPNINAGTYNICYSGTVSVPPVPFTIVKSPKLTSTLKSGESGNSITISGNGFQSFESGYVYFDANKNGMRDKGEVYKSKNSSSYGNFTTDFTIPKLNQGTYSIRYKGKSDVAPVRYTIVKSPVTLTVDTASGNPGGIITITGTHFTNSESGYVYLDVNNNGKKDSGDAYTNTLSSPSGSFTAYLTVPDIEPGTYTIRYSGKSSVTPVNYTIISIATLTTDKISAKAGSRITVYGDNFPEDEWGYVYLDSNRNGTMDSNELQNQVISNYKGSFDAYWTVPKINPGTYNIRYSGSSMVSPVSFTVEKNSGILSSFMTRGKPGDSFNFNGFAFPSNEAGYVYLDANNNWVKDSGEVYKTVHSSSKGDFSDNLMVPGIDEGTYSIRYYGKVSADPISVTVEKSTPSLWTDSTVGKPGSKITIDGEYFYSKESGYIYLDVNHNYVKDSGEAYTKITSSDFGSFRVYLTVPSINVGTYPIRYSGWSSVTPFSYTVQLNAPLLTSKTASGKPGSSISLSGSKFLNNEAGYVYLDVNNNGVLDIGEAYTKTSCSVEGNFSAYLTMPSISEGKYPIRYLGKSIVTPVSYETVESTATLTTLSSGYRGSSIKIDGSHFPGNESGYVYFDANNNGVMDSGETFTKITSSYYGEFTAYLTVPTVSEGTYRIRYSGWSSVTPKDFTVQINTATITSYTESAKPGSTISVHGSNFLYNESGYIYLDTNNNGVLDTGEAFTSIDKPYYGGFYAYLTLPTNVSGYYNVSYSGPSIAKPFLLLVYENLN
jgi:hypothetical protein